MEIDIEWRVMSLLILKAFLVAKGEITSKYCKKCKILIKNYLNLKNLTVYLNFKLCAPQLLTIPIKKFLTCMIVNKTKFFN